MTVSFIKNSKISAKFTRDNGANRRTAKTNLTKFFTTNGGPILNSPLESGDMEEIFQFIENLNKRLARGIKDLDDVRSSMAALSEIRESEIRIDMTIGPIEESFAMMNRYGLVYSSSDSERVDGLTYAWRKLHAQAGTVASHLLQIQPTFKADLLDGVEKFKEMVTVFVQEYNEKGPMVPGIPPREASDRLGIFQARFDELWRKYETYSGKDIFLVIYFLVLLDISLNVEVPIT
ncbi:dynein axonemal heavy chain 5-like [Porites lutea]|uniref:dynein axonemal heavy chain 5-like n=1 Tax=Porites lutea TaxID=51062 RepID=UPI003CC66B14